MQLIQGDCLEEMKNIPDRSIDMVLADPPYGITDCKWDSVIPLNQMWPQVKRIIKSNGAIVLMASQPFTTTLISSNMKIFKYCWVWEKTRPSNHFHAKTQPLRTTEDIVVFGQGKLTYNPQGVKQCEIIKKNTKNRLKSNIYYNQPPRESHFQTITKYPRQIIKIPSVHNVGMHHPTQKPVALMEYLIKTYTGEGETVLDFCMGSGTTGVACKNLNREFIGIELDKEYFEKAKARICAKI